MKCGGDMAGCLTEGASRTSAMSCMLQLCCFSVGGSMTMPVHQGSHEAARLTIAIWQAEAQKTGAVGTYHLDSGSIALSSPEAQQRLVAMRKPIDCSATLVGNALHVKCSMIQDLEREAQILAHAKSLFESFGTLISEECDSSTHEHVVEIIVGTENLQTNLSTIGAWLQEYDMPFTLVMWTRRVGNLPKGVCARFGVHELTNSEAQIEIGGAQRPPVKP